MKGPTRTPRLELEIDELVLHGVPAHQREAVVEAFRATLAAELARLPAAALAAVRSTPCLRVPPVTVQPDTPPASLGAALARSLAAGLGR